MTGAKLCPQCGAEYPLDQRFCPLDGSTLKLQGGTGDLVGSVVADRYHVLRKLGEGGMGQVYLAEHVRMGRKSALKVMHPKMVQDADAISRFNREAANASRIAHPHVAAIYDFGETGDGLIYLAMEYVDGEPLTALVERTGALPAARAADIIRQAADALGVAHDMGIVHRDLKPDNIMLTRNRDGSDCVKVVDFGIAKAEDASQKVTKTGLVVGTPEYMSPEQLAGDRIDGRSDTYSLGIVAFHLLTGKLPFPSESAQESMIMRLTDRPRRLAEMRGDLQWPAELQAVMDRVLERDAKLRYASAPEFGRDFVRAVAAMPETAAMEAGTVVLDSVPATRVADAVGGRGSEVGAQTAGVRRPAVGAPTALRRPPAASPPTALRRPPTARTAILIATAVLVVLGAGAAAMQFMGADGGAGADSSAGVLPEAAAAAKTDVAGPVGTEPPPTPQQVAQAAPEPGVVRTDAGVTSTPAPPSEPREDVDRELASILEGIIDEAGASRAVSRIDRLAAAGRLPRGSEEHTWAQYARAQAYLYLDRHADGCAILAGLQGKSVRPVRNAAIEATFKNVSCQ